MATIRDVAERAKVSKVTVSRVLNGASNVNLDTRTRVEQAIRELGYVPNVAAGSLRSKRTHSLALLVPDITNPFWTTVARGVEDAAQRSDYSVLLCNTDENPAKQARYLHAVLSHRVDGIIIAPYNSDAQSLLHLRQREVPTVLIDRHVPGWEVDSVMTDSVAGSLVLVRHLLSQGRRRIAVISGPSGTSTADDRVAGYALALVEAGLPVDKAYIKRGQFRTEAGETLIGELLDAPEPPTAVIAGNNYIAMGIITGIEKRGLTVGRDIALACFEDMPNGERFCPSMTVLIQPAYDMGVNAAQLLLSQIEEGATLAPRQVLLPARMIVRCTDCREGKPAEPQAVLVKSLSDVEKGLLLRAKLQAGLVSGPIHDGLYPGAHARRADVTRLLRALDHQATDCAPYFEIAAVPCALFERVVGPAPAGKRRQRRADKKFVGPEEHVRFALELGWDAVPCHLTGVDLAYQLDRLDSYVRAAHGTGLGVVVCFGPVFDKVLGTSGPKGASDLSTSAAEEMAARLDAVAERYERVVRGVCDRFADDISFLLFSETIAGSAGLLAPPDLLQASFGRGLQRVVRTVKEHGKPVGIRAAGKLEGALEALHGLGFGLVHFAEPECNDIATIRTQWAGKLALAGTLPQSLLLAGSADAVTEFVRDECRQVEIGHIIGTAAGSFEHAPAENVIALARAVELYGRGS